MSSMIFAVAVNDRYGTTVYYTYTDALMGDKRDRERGTSANVFYVNPAAWPEPDLPNRFNHNLLGQVTYSASRLALTHTHPSGDSRHSNNDALWSNNHGLNIYAVGFDRAGNVTVNFYETGKAEREDILATNSLWRDAHSKPVEGNSRVTRSIGDDEMTEWERIADIMVNLDQEIRDRDRWEVFPHDVLR